MKNYIIFCAIGFIFCFNTIGVIANNKILLDSLNGENTVLFIENKGQWNANIKYMLKSKNFHAWITNLGEITYDYYQTYINSNGEKCIKGDILKLKLLQTNNLDTKYKTNFISKKKAQLKYNYFSAESSISNVELCEEVLVENICNSVNIRYYLDPIYNQQIKYDFEIEPNGNPEEIKFKIEGANNIFVNNKNELVIQTKNNIYYHKDIFAYQIYNNKKQQITCSFVEQNGIISFNIDKYDTNKKLIIDPLIYSIIIGSTEADYAYSVAVDNTGAAYITGETYSPGFPTTAGCYDRIFNQNYDQFGNIDAFVSKISPDGSQLIFSTFIGGSKRDKSRHIALDKYYNIIILGETESANTVYPHIGFPLKSTNSTLARYNGGWDIFVTKLSSTGDSLIFSILLGGNTYDVSGGLFVDSQNKIYITGEVGNSSVPFLITPSAYNNIFRGGTSDILISVIDSSGSSILYSTLFGGEKTDSPASITVDNNKNIYITGNTTSDSLPITPTAYQQFKMGENDIFIAKFDSTLSYLLSSTYIGGNKDDFAVSATTGLTNNNNIYICGHTYSKNFPTTNGAYNTAFSDSADAIIFKLNPSLSDLLFFTTISSNSHNYATGIKLDKHNNIHIAGYTKSTNFPITYDAFFDASSSYGDAFYSVLDSSASNLIYSSYIGGYEYDYAYDIVLDTAGTAYIAGATTSGYNFPHSKSFSDTININQTLGRYDAVVFKATNKAYPGELETNINTFGNEFCFGFSQVINIYTPHAFYFSDNIFTIQLSDTNGNFNNPIIIGTLAGNKGASAIINFPNNLPIGHKYRIRVISSRPRSIGQDNGVDLTLSKEFLEILELDTNKYHCAGEKINILFKSNKCFNSNNEFKLELSDVNGSFASARIIGNGTKLLDNISQIDTIVANIPIDITTSGIYKIRLVSTSPQLISETQDLKLNLPKINILLNNNLAFCANEKFRFSFTTNQCFYNTDSNNLNNNIYFVVLSSPDGDFEISCDTIFNGLSQTSPENFYSSHDTTSLICTVPANASNSNKYKLRICSSNPEMCKTTDSSIKISIGPPYIFTTNFENKEFCKSYSFAVPIFANKCFASNNIFKIYIKSDGKFTEIGKTSVGDTLAAFTIPDTLDLFNNKATMKIVSTNPQIESVEFNIFITEPDINILSISPQEICAGRVMQVAYSSNNCFPKNTNIIIFLSDSTGNFKNNLIIGNGNLNDDTNIISATIPENISTGIYKIKLLADDTYSEEFELKINHAEVFIHENFHSDSFCTGASFHINYISNNCFNFNNIFKIILSDEFGNFDTNNSKIIGESISTTSGDILIILPTDLSESDIYRLKITSTSPSTSKIYNNYISVKKPEIIIDSLKNLYICIKEDSLVGSSNLKILNSTQIIIPFIASDCFNEPNKFILQLAPNGNFSQTINLDTCAWNERVFRCKFPDNLPENFYRMRVISTSPELISKDNGLDIKFAKATIDFSGSIPTTICKNDITKFNYYATNCFDEDNIFYLEISNNLGDFMLSRIIAYSTENDFGVFNSVFPHDVPVGSGYKLRIRSTSPSKIFYNKNLSFTVTDPEILTGNLNRTLLARNDTISVPFNTNCISDSIRNITEFVVQLSDPNGNYKNSLEIGKKNGWEPDGMIFSRIPLKANDGNKYRIRVISKEPNSISGNNNEKDITISGNVSINEKEFETNSIINIFPNPFFNLINIFINNSSVNRIELSDLLGEIIFSSENITSTELQIDAKNLSEGLYFMTIYTNLEIKKIKLIKTYK